MFQQFARSIIEFINIDPIEDTGKLFTILIVLIWAVFALLFFVPALICDCNKLWKFIWIIIGAILLVPFSHVDPVEIVDKQQIRKLAREPLNVSILSFNLRDSSIDTNANQWQDRVRGTRDQILQTSAQVIGSQEGEVQQLVDIEIYEDYGIIGQASDEDGKQLDSCIIFDMKRLQLQNQGFINLSDTPDEHYTKFPESKRVRTLTYGQYTHLQSQQTFYVFNTHLDHASEVARQKQIDVVLQKINEVIKDSNVPVILTGDLNSLTNSAVYKKIINAGFQNVRHQSAKLGHNQSNQQYTFHAYIGQALENPSFLIPCRAISYILSYIPYFNLQDIFSSQPEEFHIDFIFTKNLEGSMELLQTNIINDAPHGQLPSDHYPVNAVFEMIPAY